MVDEKVLELLRCLKALASEDGGAFPEERARAIRHISRLLAKHQLSEADIPAGRVSESVVCRTFDAGMAAPKGHWWSLLQAVAGAHDCRTIYFRRYVGTPSRKTVMVDLIGMESDAIIAEYLFGYCWTYLRTEADAEGRDSGESGYDLRRWIAEYIVAAGREIARRVREEREGAGADLPRLPDGRTQTAGLICLKQQAVSEFVQQKYTSLRSSSSYTSYHGSGSAAGAAKGRSMPLRKGVRGDSGGPAPRLT